MLGGSLGALAVFVVAFLALQASSFKVPMAWKGKQKPHPQIQPIRMLPPAHHLHVREKGFAVAAAIAHLNPAMAEVEATRAACKTVEVTPNRVI